MLQRYHLWATPAADMDGWIVRVRMLSEESMNKSMGGKDFRGFRFQSSELARIRFRLWRKIPTHFREGNRTFADTVVVVFAKQHDQVTTSKECALVATYAATSTKLGQCIFFALSRFSLSSAKIKVLSCNRKRTRLL